MVVGFAARRHAGAAGAAAGTDPETARRRIRAAGLLNLELVRRDQGVDQRADGRRVFHPADAAAARFTISLFLSLSLPT